MLHTLNLKAGNQKSHYRNIQHYIRAWESNDSNPELNKKTKKKKRPLIRSREVKLASMLLATSLIEYQLVYGKI